MSDTNRKSGEGIKVTDRRIFTSEGARRDPDAPREEAAPPRAVPPSSSAVPEEPVQSEGVDFEGFTQYLGQIAIQQMLGGKDSATGESVTNLADARQTIEILSMLQEKTRGNLSPREANSLDQLLYHLKLEYARRAAPEGG